MSQQDDVYEKSGLLQIAFNSNGRDFYPQTVKELLEWRDRAVLTGQLEELDARL
jgi:hypothetical protein